MDLESTIKMGSTISSSWIDRIHSTVPDVKVYGTVSKVPEIRLEGEVSLTEDQRQVANARQFKFNDQHATVDIEPLLLGTNHTVFHAKTLSFSELSVLREANEHGFILSSCVVMVCEDTQHLVVHHRAPSPDSATYPDCLHTIGGGFDPLRDELSFVETAIREVREETRASVLVEQLPPIALFLEIPTRFMQVVFLGANISVVQFNNLRDNWEAAGLVKIPFDKLDEILSKPLVRRKADGSKQIIDWVPAGKAHVLTWLALGAPGLTSTETPFGGMSPNQLFDKLTHS